MIKRPEKTNEIHLESTQNPSKMDPITEKILFNQKNLVIESEALENLSSQVHLMQQQLDLYQHEGDLALEKRRKAESLFTKDVYSTLMKAKKTNKDIMGLIELFFQILGLHQGEWMGSKDSVKNFGILKQKLMNVDVENIKEEMTQKCMFYWKNYQTLSSSFKKANKGASKVLDWITAIVEYKLKKETINSLKRRFIDLQNQVNSHLDNISEIKSNMIALSSAKKRGETKLSYGDSEVKNPQRVLFPFKDINSSRKIDRTSVEGHRTLEYHLLNLPQSFIKHSRNTTEFLGSFTTRDMILNEAPIGKLHGIDDTQRITATAHTLSQSTKKLYSINFNQVAKDISDIADNTQSELSQIFDLKINPNESQLEAIKPQPRPASADRSKGRNSISKQNMIIMNNLRLNMNSMQRTPSHLDPNFSNKKSSNLGNDFESLRSDIRKDMFISEEEFGETGQDTIRGGKGHRGLKEILSTVEREPQLDSQGICSGCCRRNFQNKFFCV